MSSKSDALQEERITMLELRHSPWCEGLDCVDSLEEPLADPLEGDGDHEGGLQEGPGSQDNTISSSLQLVLPSDFAPSRVNSEILLPCAWLQRDKRLTAQAYPILSWTASPQFWTNSLCMIWHGRQHPWGTFASTYRFFSAEGHCS